MSWNRGEVVQLPLEAFGWMLGHRAGQFPQSEHRVYRRKSYPWAREATDRSARYDTSWEFFDKGWIMLFQRQVGILQSAFISF